MEAEQLVVDVGQPNNAATVPSSTPALDALMVNGTVYTLTSTSDTGHSELLDKLAMEWKEDEKSDSINRDSSSSCRPTGGAAATTTNLDAQINQSCIEVDTARGMVCMKVGDTIYQMPLCGLPPTTLDLATGQILTSQDSVVSPQGNNFLELSIADPVADVDTGQTLPLRQNLTVTEPSRRIRGPSSAVPSSSVPLDDTNKRKGGWPKGKRRKPATEDTSAPKAPTSGYVLYAMERRKKLEDENPQLFFPEVTKMLGNEWSKMPAPKKQKYLDRAEADKKRYIRELQEYQRSDAYQDFMKKKKLNGLCSSLEERRSSIMDLDDDEGLCCKICDKYFNSLHNKKEHMLGKLHLQAVKGEYELQQYNNANQKNNELLVPSSHNSLAKKSSNEGKEDNSAVDINSFVQEFMEKNMDRELEIKALKESLQANRELNIQYGKQITEMRDLDTKLENDVATLKAYGTSLNAQIDMLKMVPTLFGVINF